ncbi:hypothetical protein D9M68_703940 [compost metagenome]
MRAVQRQRAGAWGDGRRDVLGLDAEAVLRAHRHRDHLGPAGAEHRLVGDVHGLGHYHFVARIEQALHHAEQRALGAGQHHHLVGRDLLPAALVVPGGDTLAQGELAAYIGVVGAAVEQAVDGGLDYGLRGVEIRVAD